MNLFAPTQNLFSQLHSVLKEITSEEYTTRSSHLSGATIGQHVRHIIELFLELNKGYQMGTVNYEARKRDYLLESENGFAIQALQEILRNIHKTDADLYLVSDLSVDGSDSFIIQTTYFRELLYNIEHTVHHMALIRVAVQQVTDIALPETFGVAAATIKHHQRLCAQ